jgi:hypothetical protein
MLGWQHQSKGRSIKSSWWSVQLVLTAVICTTALSGCMRMLESYLVWVFADPRQKNHEYYAEVKLSVHVGNVAIDATRYAEVFYLTGGDKSSGATFPFCDKSRRSCWRITESFFAGLPGGDLLEVGIDDSTIDWRALRTGQILLAAGKTPYKILRDQPADEAADELGSCRDLNEHKVKQDYGVSLYDRIEITVLRLDDDSSVGEIVSPQDIYEAQIFDKEPCSVLLKQIAKRQSISAR